QAHAGLAQAYWQQQGYGTLSTGEALAKAMPEVERALALDPQLGEGHALLGLIKVQHGEIEVAETSLRRAIELNPNDAMAFMWYAVLMGRRDLKKRNELIQKALTLDPLAPIIHTNIGYWSAGEGRVQEAIDEFKRAIAIDPAFVEAYSGLAWMSLDHLDRPDEALEYMRRAVAADPGNLGSR